MIGKTRQQSPDGSMVTITEGVGPARGILRRRLEGGKFWHSRTAPPAALQHLIEHFWIVRWDLRGHPPQRQETLPHPNVHFVIGSDGSRIMGPHTARFTRILDGNDQVFGVKFRPGGFYPFIRRPVASFADDALDPRSVFGDAVAPVAAEVLARGADDAAMIDVMTRFLVANVPAADATVETVAGIVAAVVHDRSITRVEHLLARPGLNQRRLDKRALQRLFAKYVGVSPKWVINRYRLHDAIERLAQGTTVDWAAFALELGYFDQAHFIRDFRKLVGQSPAEYARSQPPPLP